MPLSNPPLLEVRHVSKRYPGVLALDRVDLSLERGEVLAVVGENGAGKSTLMKILAGVQTPDSGALLVEGDQVVIDSVSAALRHRIALIHQELNLADNLDVGANIFLGREPRRLGLIDDREVRQRAAQALRQVGLEIAPSKPLRELGIGHQQMVEIAKALTVDARVLIMDEPTSSLSAHETEQLFSVVRDLKSRNVSIIYISHRLGEVETLADRVLVLRDGCNAGELLREEISHERLVRLMVGRDISQFYARRPHPVGEVVLRVEGLATAAWPHETVDFELHRGEIVGLAGLVGAGRSELLTTLFGVEPPLQGRMQMEGQTLRPSSPQRAIEAGLALVPEDRKQQGLIIDMAIRANVSLASLRNHRWGIRNAATERRESARMMQDLRIKTDHDQRIARFLSGGNQQKVVIAKWLTLRPRVLLLDEPTRGVDIGAKQEIYRLMEELAEQGVAILFASSEMEEVIGMSDRVLVMHEGRLAGSLQRGELSEEAVMRLATGAHSEEGGSREG